MKRDRESLDGVIEQMINLGMKDPLDIARKIEATYDDEWRSGQLLALAEEMIAERARQRLSSMRRSAENALRPGDVVARGELQLRSAWVPGYDGEAPQWKPAHKLTVADLHARARFYERLAVAGMRRAFWCREVAELMEAEGAETLGNLKAELPALPDENDVVELVA